MGFKANRHSTIAAEQALAVRKDDKWIYEVEFICKLGQCDVTDGFTIYVRLDGTIVESEVTLGEKEK